jgi:hypothetical protein
MSDESLREPEQIRQTCARKLRPVETGGILTAVLGCLLARLEGEATFKAFLGAEADLIRNVHGIAKVAGLGGDEVGYLLGRIAMVKGTQ